MFLTITFTIFPTVIVLTCGKELVGIHNFFSSDIVDCKYNMMFGDKKKSKIIILLKQCNTLINVLMLQVIMLLSVLKIN